MNCLRPKDDANIQHGKALVNINFLEKNHAGRIKRISVSAYHTIWVIRLIRFSELLTLSRRNDYGGYRGGRSALYGGAPAVLDRKR